MTWIWPLLLCWAAPCTQAVIFYSTGDPEFNTTAPVGDLAGSGWELQGTWGWFLGTAIAPHFFITVRHVGGAVGDTFVMQGNTYTAVAWFDDPQSDLRIWQVSETFPAYAQLYSKSDEQGQLLVVHGRGTQRGDAVTVQGVLGPELKGWRWGAGDARQRWGENRVESIENGDVLIPSGSGQRVGDVLRVTFSRNGVANEAHLSTGDSGGGVFLRDGAVWKLAGLSYAVDGPYNLTNSGAGFAAALFDLGGTYSGGEGNWTLNPDLIVAQPGAFYVVRLSAHTAWIQSVIAPAVSGAVLESAAAPGGPYSAESAATSDATTRMIKVPAPSTDRFYRLAGATALTIKSVTIVGRDLVFEY